VADGLGQLVQMGFQGFQLEVFHADALADWAGRGARLVYQRSAELGLRPTQFVAHFMLEAFADGNSLMTDAAFEQMETVLDIVGHFQDCCTVTVPLPAFQATPIPLAENYRQWFDRCADKIARLQALVEDSGRRLALEILPSAVIGGIDGFLRLCERLGTETLGVNLDTGHAWACKESVYLIPAKLGSRIMGTHLCDNFGNENLSLRPGAGSIDWPRLVKALKACGYIGSWDIEIICKPEDAADEYGRSRNFIMELIN
jgi:sugar phosphate isomerase/epimerase